MIHKIVSKMGYCNQCRRNVEHCHRFRGTTFRALDTCTFRLLPNILGVGRWHCRICNRQTLILNARRREALTFSAETHADESGFASAGNFIKRDQSLVIRSERSSRYSKKFRLSAVQKLLQGHTSLLTLREELNVTDADLISWIAEIIENQSEQIEHLNRMVEVLLERAPENVRLESQIEITPRD